MYTLLKTETVKLTIRKFENFRGLMSRELLHAHIQRSLFHQLALQIILYLYHVRGLFGKYVDKVHA